MKVHFALLSILIGISLGFVLFSGYKLYKAQAISPPTPQEVLSQLVEATPSVEAPAAEEKTVAPVPAPTQPAEVPAPAPASSPRPRHPGNAPGPSASPQPEEQKLQKIGTVNVTAGAVTHIALEK